MKTEKIYAADEQKIAEYARAMGHPARIKILKLLSDQSSCYTGDLTERLPLAQSTVSQHLKMLKEAGLIEGEIQQPRIRYCLNRKHWSEAKRLFETMLDN